MKNKGNDIIELTAVASGDIMVHGIQLKSACDENGNYDFHRYFKNTAKYIKDADISICNVETTMAEDTDYSGFPRFNTPDVLADAIADAGFNVAAAANNHTFDTMKEGIIRTKAQLEQRGIHVTGTRKSPEDSSYAIFNVGDVSVAVLNYTYETDKKAEGKTLNNHLLDEESALLVNTFSTETLEEDLQRIGSDIKYVKDNGADIVIVYYHWGYEYDRVSRVVQKYMAYRTALMDCDAILGSHSHVLQESDIIKVCVNGKDKSVPVFYGLGNYIWGVYPIRGRETVLNGALAKFVFEFDLKNRCIVSVKKDFIPLVINISKTKNNYQFDVLSLNDMDDESKSLFSKGRHAKKIDEIINEIENTINNKLTENKKFYFDSVLNVPVGEKVLSIGEILPKSILFDTFKSDDAIVASVLKNGEIVGNSEGYTGITAIDKDGKEHMFIVHAYKVNVYGKKERSLPVLIDENNTIRDLYLPEKRVFGEKWKLPKEMYLREDAAIAWLQMYKAARSCGVELKCLWAFRTKKMQLIRQNKYAEVYGDSATRKRYMPIGCSDHHLALSIDIANEPNSSTTRGQAINWVLENAHCFGFVPRKLKNSIKYTAYVHVRYYPDRMDALCMTKHNLTLERYLENYENIRMNFHKNPQFYVPVLKQNHNSPTKTNEIYNLENGKLTIKIICDIIGVEVPKKLAEIQHDVVPKITTTDVGIIPGSAFFYNKYLKDELMHCRKAIAAGASVIIAEKQIYDENAQPLPTIIVDNSIIACAKVANSIRKLYSKTKSIGVTGSAGKTTTFELLCNVFDGNFNTHHTKLNNANNLTSTLNLVQRLQKEHEVYIQEIGASFPYHVESSSMAVNPDIAIITNIGTAHLDLYKTRENYINDKLSILKHINNGGIAVLNIDDPILSEYAGKMKNAVTFSIENSEADYYAKDVVQTPDGLSVVVVERKTGTETPVMLNIVGLHNAYNIVSVFAAARWLGLTEQQIQEGLQNYAPKGTRQVLKDVGGRKLYIDCFSSIDLSIITSMQTLASMKHEPGQRKFAVLWELMRTGDFGNESYIKIANEVKNLDIDYVFVFGKSAQFLADEMSGGKIDVRFTDDWYELNRWITEMCHEGDIVLFKGQHMQSTALSIDACFGTDYYVNNANERKTAAKAFDNPKFSGVTIKDLVAVIEKNASDEINMEIPDVIDDIPVIYLNTELFKGSKMKSVKMGDNLITVGRGAFENCKKLKSVKFGSSLRNIESDAFKGCSALETVELPDSCINIEGRAFANCSNLKKVILSSNCCKIAENAFENSKKVELVYKDKNNEN